MNVVFAGGGTGGHLYPAIALADALRGRANVAFIGTADRIEAQIVPQAGYELHTIAARPLSRSAPIEAIATAGMTALGTAQAARLLHALQPDLVVAAGGYVCFPAIAAARLLRTARRSNAVLALIEPNAHPGLTNRLLAPLVDEVWGAYAPGDPAFGEKYVHTGIPVRAELFHPDNRIEAARRLNLDPARRTILAMGGSQGARSLNEAVAALVTRRSLPAEWQVLHVSGERDHAYMQAEEREPFGENRVALVPYLHKPADAFALADLVIARAGASTLGELAALGLPSILVPYPHAAEDHQARNAEVFERAGAAAVIADGALDADALWWTLRTAMEPERLQSMSAAARWLGSGDAVATILARIEALTARKEQPG